MIFTLIIGHCMGIRSERRPCEELHLNLAYRWICQLGLEGDVPDHSTFSKNRHGRFRNSDLRAQGKLVLQLRRNSRECAAARKIDLVQTSM